MRMLCEGGAWIKKPSVNQILDEIELGIMNSIRSAQYLIDSTEPEKRDENNLTADCILVTALEYWEKFSSRISELHREA